MSTSDKVQGHMTILRVPTAQGKKGKWPKTKSVSGKTQGIWKTQGIFSKHMENTGNFVSSSCKCSNSKSKGYLRYFFQKLDRSGKSVLFM